MKKLTDLGLSQSLFEEWREPREGTENPTKVDSPVWNWLIRTKLSAWGANKASEHDCYDSPTWSFDRMGQSATQLPDGRTIYIAGEHEDGYDPNFYIYNDVIVKHADGSLETYIYPKNIFPPTDFHSTTLIDNKIIIVGCLGYSEQRDAPETPVYTLDLNTFFIEKISTTGAKPGWIYGHLATLANDKETLLITGGESYRDKSKSTCENINEWTLNTKTWKWELAKENHWVRWEYIRKDNEYNLLWELRQALWNQEHNWKTELSNDIKKLKDKLGYEPDLSSIKSLYQPSINFKKLPEVEGEYNQFKILINDVVVRYKEESWDIQVCVEGYLVPEIIESLKNDLLIKLNALIKTDWELLDI